MCLLACGVTTTTTYGASSSLYLGCYFWLRHWLACAWCTCRSQQRTGDGGGLLLFGEGLLGYGYSYILFGFIYLGTHCLLLQLTNQVRNVWCGAVCIFFRLSIMRELRFLFKPWFARIFILDGFYAQNLQEFAHRLESYTTKYKGLGWLQWLYLWEGIFSVFFGVLL